MQIIPFVLMPLKMMGLLIGLLLVLFAFVGCTNIAPKTSALNVSLALDTWQERVFHGHTDYHTMQDNGLLVIKAISNQSASARFKTINVDLEKTPFLNWRWKTEGVLGPLNEQTKAGDDYSARLYVIIKNRPFELKPRSLTYVWSNTSPKHSHWFNPYSKQVVMVALQSGNMKAQQWVSEKRNVLVDLKRYFKEDATQIIGLAFMTDTDNSKTKATAYYADIHFSSE